MGQNLDQFWGEIQRLLENLNHDKLYNETIKIQQFANLRQINIYLDKFLEDPTNDSCKFVKNLTMNIVDLHKDLDKLRRKDLNQIDTILSISRLQTHINEIFGNANLTEYFIPIDFSVDSTEYIFDFVEFYTSYKDNVLSLTFEIPIYKKANLFVIYPKPIHSNYKSYILNMTQDYVTFEFEKPIIYTENDINELCFEKSSTKFCKQPIQNNSSNCLNDKEINLTNNKCFIPFVYDNVATQIYSDIYFTIVFPMFVFVNCGTNHFPIYIDRSVRFSNLTDCSLKTEFFEYNNKLNEFPYKIHISRHLITVNSVMIDKKKSQIIKILFEYEEYFAIFLITSTIFTFSGLVYFWYLKFKQWAEEKLNERTFYVSAAVDTEV